MTRLLLWRHGRTEWNATGRFQGQLDVPLDSTGHDQARRAAERLAERQPAAIVSSDLRRAADTSAALAAITGLTVSYDPRLRERFHGEWQGLLLPEVRERWPAALARWQAGELEGGVDEAGVESVDSVSERMSDALHDVVRRMPGATVVVTTHGGAARRGVAALLDWPAAVVPTLGGLDNCHYSELRHHPQRGWQLHAHNVG